MSDIYREFGVDFLRTRYAGPSAAEIKMAREIARLRDRVEELERVRGVAQSLINTASRLGWIAAATLRDDLRAALKEAKP